MICNHAPPFEAMVCDHCNPDEEPMTPSTLIDLYTATRRQGNTSILCEIARTTGAVLIVPRIGDIARFRTFKARALSESVRGMEPAPILLDPSILPIIAEEWDRDVARLEAVALADRNARAIAEARVRELEGKLAAIAKIVGV